MTRSWTRAYQETTSAKWSEQNLNPWLPDLSPAPWPLGDAASGNNNNNDNNNNNNNDNDNDNNKKINTKNLKDLKQSAQLVPGSRQLPSPRFGADVVLICNKEWRQGEAKTLECFYCLVLIALCSSENLRGLRPISEKVSCNLFVILIACWYILDRWIA